MSPLWNLKHPLLIQARSLARQADARLVRFTGALLSLDVFFIALFSVDRITAIYYDRPPVLNKQWSIGIDGSYPEVAGYLKEAIIVCGLISIRKLRQWPIYPAVALIYTIVFLDDALQLHEQLGRGLANDLALQAFAGRLSVQLGQLIFWAMLGIILLIGVRAAFVRSRQKDRFNGMLLLAAFAVLVLFAVLVDSAHAVVKHNLRFPGDELLFTVIEDGGEQITLSLTCSLALLIRRDVRAREGT